jgi:hypothetical protein
MAIDENFAKKSNVKVKLAVISALTGIIAIVPPLISAVRTGPAISQSGTGNSATVGSNNHTTNNYVSMWFEGAKTMVGVNQKPVISTPTTSSESIQPEVGAIGTIVTNASLLNEIKWRPDPSRITRLLSFSFHVEATSPYDKQGSLDVTLAREDKDICTISLNNKTSRDYVPGVKAGDAACQDTLVANASASYTAKVKATEMRPLVIRLNHVSASRK